MPGQLLTCCFYPKAYIIVKQVGLVSTKQREQWGILEKRNEEENYIFYFKHQAFSDDQGELLFSIVCTKLLYTEEYYTKD